MPLFDLPLDELTAYRSPRPEPADFDEFWAATLAETSAHPLDVVVETHELALTAVEASHVWFAGYGGQPVHGLFLRPSPAVVAGPLPVVVQFLGYGDGTGSPLDWLGLPAAGFATLVMDTRGQGARARRGGATGDHDGSRSPHVEGFLTKGVLDRADYYYRRVFADAVRAVECAAQLDRVDAARLAVAGTSQGGGIALAAAALADGVRAAVVNVPFLCHYSRAVDVTASEPYAELLRFLRTHRARAEDALATLDYFDGVNFAGRASAPALFSVALMDDVCPPSTVYAAHNAYAGPTRLEIYPYNEHEGGGIPQDELTIAWLRDHLAVPTARAAN
ncbi:acetylxylan esterase [Nocardioides deserti]|uniref:Acetylxylan esterase n=1 Tax=Nocardioides deserti TaxID=1588644 RepID=A0ABR6U4J2_9ACTN|nr:acetylxylan esterase [Nocardioides deserti]MBC2959308.1 acetylxylan esterase [Nocardioides deserti]GGO68081.1 cephalosporin-C deacetylase [Nocardioides deserti]